MGIVAPVLYELFHTPRSQATLTMPSFDGNTLRITAINKGDAPASLIKASVDSDYLAQATKVRLRSDADALIQPGAKLLTFDIVPLLDEDDSYRSSLEILLYMTQKKPIPRTTIRFHIMQSDGNPIIQEVPLDAEKLFALLRANADRCSAISAINFENGCIGRGTPPEEQFPIAQKQMQDGEENEVQANTNAPKPLEPSKEKK